MVAACKKANSSTEKLSPSNVGGGKDRTRVSMTNFTGVPRQRFSRP